MNFKFDSSKVYFTSDTHFNHTNIIRFCLRRQYEKDIKPNVFLIP